MVWEPPEGISHGGALGAPSPEMPHAMGRLLRSRPTAEASPKGGQAPRP